MVLKQILFEFVILQPINGATTLYKKNSAKAINTKTAITFSRIMEIYTFNMSWQVLYAEYEWRIEN